MKLSLRLCSSLFKFWLPVIASLSYAQTAFSHAITPLSLSLSPHQVSNSKRTIKNQIDLRLASIPVEGTINGDQLVTINGIPWAWNGWPFSKVLEIQRDSIDPTIVGKVVLDRHGVDAQPEYGIRSPFVAPEPGRVVLVSNWGSNNSGCFLELIIQVATSADRRIDPRLIVPTQVDMVINGQRLTVNAVNSPGANRYGSFPYTYSLSVQKNNQQVSQTLRGIWTMSRHIFALNAPQAKLLGNAPAQNIPLRVTLANRSPITIPIGKGTVERWPSVYGFNAACTPKRGR